jgi:pimeloyl-ACP methyl ester carboxylesterase
VAVDQEATLRKVARRSPTLPASAPGVLADDQKVDSGDGSGRSRALGTTLWRLVHDHPVTGDLRIERATSNGRTLTFAEWGDHDGFPVFQLHGTPGSRLLRHWDESKYVEVGARVITYDRPGYGGSDRCRGRDVVDCVADVVAIADTLGIDRFAVTGGSGGGPHALAVAARLPGRVTRASCEVGIVPYGTPDFDWFEGMDPLNVKEFGWALDGEDVLAPELEREAAELQERVADDPSKVLGDDWELSASDRTQLARVEYHEIIRQGFTEAFRNGVWGWVDDDLCFTRNWRFDLAEIRIPTRIVYGVTDVLVPRQHGEWLGRNVANAEVVIEDETGHLPDPAVVAERYGWLVRDT